MDAATQHRYWKIGLMLLNSIATLVVLRCKNGMAQKHVVVSER
jgi:hypothetical protein